MILFGIILVLIAVWMARKNWRSAFSVVLFFTGLSLFLANHPAFRGFFQSSVISLFVSQAESYGQQLNKFYTAVERVQGDLQNTSSNLLAQQAQNTGIQSNLQRAFEDLHNQSVALETSKRRIEQLAGQLATAQTNLLAQQNDVVSLVSKLTQMRKSLDAQEQKLSDVESMTIALYEQRMREEYFISDTNHVVVGQKPDGAYHIYISLEHAPIAQSIDINLPSFTLYKGCWSVVDNNVILIQLATGSFDSFKTAPFMITYTPDPKRKTAHTRLRVSDDGRVLVGESKCMDSTIIVVK